jgi:hypothetical protein
MRESMDRWRERWRERLSKIDGDRWARREMHTHLVRAAMIADVLEEAT